MSRRGRGLPGAALWISLATVLASCAPEPAFKPTVPAHSPATPSVPAASSPPVATAPTVARPLDAGKYLADPCASLSAAQQAAFNVTSSRVTSNEYGVSCIWKIGSGSTSPGIVYSTAFTDGLSRLYALNDIGWWDGGYFEPTEVDGYPAVYANLADLRETGKCNLAVAINDQLFFDASVVTPPANDACQGARNTAKAILRTIKEGA